jgi:hypothetical protein
MEEYLAIPDEWKDKDGRTEAERYIAEHYGKKRE